jgi:hypothetical protein
MIFIKNNLEIKQIEFHICNNQLKGNVKINVCPLGMALG